MNKNELLHPFGGVFAATICPMHEDGAIDREALERHLSDIASTDGIAGFLVNGHAGENFALTRDELQTVIRTARAASGKHRVVAGINSERSDVAAQMGDEAVNAGADAVMVFPPFSWAMGVDDQLIQAHHRAVADAANAPLFLFQGSVNSGKTAFSMETLKRLLEIESIIGIKEGSWETSAYEATRRLVKDLRPEVGVMASGDEHLFTCFVIGSDGSLVSLATVVPKLIVALDRAVQNGDIQTGRTIHEKLYVLAKKVYAAPGHLATLRLKTCLMLLGKLSSVASRAPIMALSDNEKQALRDALVKSGVL